MKDIKSIIESNSDDLTEANLFCREVYDNIFSQYFVNVKRLQQRLSDKLKPITDDELSEILTMCPLNMISVSSELNVLRRNVEVLKLKSKNTKLELSLGTETDSSEYVKRTHMLENDLLICLYESIIKQVEGEMSYVRELIMSAKKIWDANRKSEDVVPISPVSGGKPNIGNYIK